jgi:thioredoxin-like negative regulator of GroEL
MTRVRDHRPKQTAPQTAAKPELLIFYSDRSGACRRLDGFLAQALQRRRNHHTFVLHGIEADEHPDLIRRFAIEKLPTLLVVEETDVRARLEQPRGCVEIQPLLAPWLH